MSDEFESEDQRPSDGGGLRRQLEEALQKNKELEQAREAAVTEALERGRQQAQRRFQALEVFGKDRPGLAEAWVEKNPEGDLTLEAAKEFALPYGVTLGEEPPPEQAPEPVPDEVKQAAGAFQTPVAAVPGGQPTYTPEQIRQIGLKDQAEALRLIDQGLMKSG